jgi:hypothetical protein
MRAASASNSPASDSITWRASPGFNQNQRAKSWCLARDEWGSLNDHALGIHGAQPFVPE